MEITWKFAMALAADDASDSEEAELIAACRAGDEDAFARLVRRHERRVFRLASRFFHQRHEVEDAAQETFLTAWRKLDRYSFKAPFEHWLTRVCLNCCYARLRRRRPVEPMPEAQVEAEQVDPDIRLEVASLLRRLPEADRFVLVLMHAEGWSTAEISERTGWSRAKVKVRAYRARLRLRKLLEEDRA